MSDWSCFTDVETGRCYKSRLAAERSDTDLREIPVSSCDENTVGTLSTAALQLDLTRLDETIVLRQPCPKHRFEDAVQSQAESCYDRKPPGTDVLVINLEDGLLPMLVTASRRRGIVVDSFTRQDYLDDMRRREAVHLTLESMRLTLQERRRRLLIFAFAYGQEARLHTLQDLTRGGCTYFETPVMGSIDDLVRYLEEL